MTRRQFSGLLTALLLLATGLAAQTNQPAEAAVVRPTVTGVAATTGSTAGGEFVTLHGTGFNGVYVVAFGGVKTRSLHVWSSTELTVRVPRHAAGRVYVRVARPGAASVLTSRATYTYAATPRGLATQGTPQEAPEVATFIEPIAPNLALDCATSTFCAAVGDVGAAVWDGASWSTPTTIGSGDEEVLLSCPVGGFCLAYSSDGHTWRYANGAWTDLGAFPGLGELDCGGPLLCGGVVGDQAVVFDGVQWSAPATLFAPGVAGISCPHQTRCVANSGSGFYRIWAEGWGPSRPMWNTAALRNSSLTRGVTGGLECSTVNYCISTGVIFTDIEHFRMSVFTGSTWSPAREVIATTDQIRTDVDCATNNFCLHRARGTDFLGDAYQQYRVLNGTARSASTASPTARGQYDVACWAPYQCIGIGFHTWTRLGAA
jgi:hypothetical protein